MLSRIPLAELARLPNFYLPTASWSKKGLQDVFTDWAHDGRTIAITSDQAMA
jgi:hypothetical protein